MEKYRASNICSSLLFIIVILFSLIQADLTCSEIYKWVGEDGSVFYSEIPPPEEQEVHVSKMKESINYSKLVLPDELDKLKYDGTSESLLAIKNSTFLNAQEGNIIAIDICRQAMIAIGDEKGLLQIGHYGSRNLGSEILEPWVEKVKILSDNGDVFYKIVLATIYLEGDWGRSDRKKALKLYKEAAEQGYHDAYCKLGIVYQEGRIISRDIQKAMEYYHTAGKMGNLVAYYNIAALYYHGKYVQKNYVKAVKYYTMAADRGYSRAQNDLGLCHYYGHGVPVNKRQSKRWIQKSAEQGYYPAEQNVFNLDF